MKRYATLLVILFLLPVLATPQVAPSIDRETGLFEPSIPLGGAGSISTPHLSLVTGEVDGLWLGTGAGYDWYVDSVNGSDSNTGRSASDAFITVAKLETVQAVGEKVCFVAGSHFYDQWDYLSSMVGEKCGIGAKPIFDGADTITGWTLDNGTTYSKTVTVEQSGQFVSVFEDGVRLDFDSGATCQTGVATLAVGTYCVENPATLTPTIYLKTTGDDNPSGYTMEVTVRAYGIYGEFEAPSAATGATLRNLKAQRNLSATGAIVAGPFTTLEDVEVEWTNSHGIWLEHGSTINGASCTNFYGAISQAAGVGDCILTYENDAGETDGVEISNVAVTQEAGTQGYGSGRAIFSHGSVRIDSIIVDTVTASGLDGLVSPTGATSIQISNIGSYASPFTLAASSSVAPIYINMEVASPAATVVLDNVNISGGISGVIHYCSGEVGTMTITDSLVKSESTSRNTLYSVPGCNGVIDFTVEDSEIWGKGPVMSTVDGASTVTMNRNLFYLGDMGPQFPDFNIYTGDYNVWRLFYNEALINPATSLLFKEGVTNKSLNDFACESGGNEANSTPTPAECP